MSPVQRPVLATWLTSIAAISLLSIAPAPVHAQNAEADKRFEEGKALLDAGELEEACRAFEDSNRIEPGAGILLHIGECKERLHRLASALTAYRDALGRAKDPRKKALATQRAAALEPRVSRLTIAVAPEARVAGLIVARGGQPIDAADYGRAVLVDGGSHEITASAPGYRSWSTSIQIESEREKASVSVPRLVGESPRVEVGSGGAAGPDGSGVVRSVGRPASSAAPPLGRVSVGLAFGGTSGRNVIGGVRFVAGYPVPRGSVRATLQALYTRVSLNGSDVYNHTNLVATTLGLDYLWAWGRGLASAAGLGVGLEYVDDNYQSGPYSVTLGALRASPLVVRLGAPNLELGVHFMYVDRSSSISMLPTRALVGVVGVDWFVW
jgi:hypothetical protein